MNFHSILHQESEGAGEDGNFHVPDFAHDLNFDQIVDRITGTREEYNLKPLFYAPLKTLTEIEYRHEVMRDLEDNARLESIRSFTIQFSEMRRCLKLSKTLHYKNQKERFFLDAIDIYCHAVQELRNDLCDFDPKSNGLLTFRDDLSRYTESSIFRKLHEETQNLESDLSGIRYCVRIKGTQVTVWNYDSEIDYSIPVEEAFSKFKEDEAKDYRVAFSATSGMNHVEAQILDYVAQLNPEIFRTLDEFCARNGSYAEKGILDFDREIQFYVAYLEYIERFKQYGLKFCYPEVSDSSKQICSRDGFDLALADKLIREKSVVVCNDFFLEGNERIFVVTGPNQGGKTTFARTFGQLHYLACLGCPVPGTEARLFLFDQLFTHFEREEDINTFHGKLQDDLVGIHSILNRATPASIIILNEIFSSTTLKDAVYLGKETLGRLAEMDCLGVCVTFLDELSSLNEKIVSAVAAINPQNPALRTYKIERRPADGLAYALALVEKYRLTPKHLTERLSR